MKWLLPVRLSALALTGFAIAFGVAALRLGFWGDSIPGSGLIPFLACILMLPIGIVLLLAPLDDSRGVLQNQAFAHPVVENLNQCLALDVESAGRRSLVP